MEVTVAEAEAVLVASAAVAVVPFLASRESATVAAAKVAWAEDGSTCRGSCTMRSNWPCSR